MSNLSERRKGESRRAVEHNSQLNEGDGGASENKPQHTSAEKSDPTRSMKAVAPLKEVKDQASPAQTMLTVPQVNKSGDVGMLVRMRSIIQKYEDENG
jgi:hypothetical protein